MRLSDEGDYRLHICFAQALNRGHWPEIPVMLDRTDLDGELKGSVGVVAWLVNAGEMRWTPIRPAEIFAVTLGAIRRVQLVTAGDQFWILGVDSGVAV